MTMKKLLFLAVAFGLTLASSAVQAVGYPPCDTYCPTASATSKCLCPVWTDRPYAVVTCGSWNRVGGCWYE
jgi:hypothetical protein